MTLVKICGLTRESDLRHAIDCGADRVGFVIVPTSPRAIAFSQAQTLIRLADELGVEAWVVATYAPNGGGRRPHVDWLDQLVEETPEIAAVQLHGKETPQDVALFVSRHPLTPVVKALGVATRADLERAEEYPAADAFLLDAKPPPGADREGGFGKPFDWSILRGFRPLGHEDWILSGGLTPENVAEAIRIADATQVDVSSGVELSPGVKDPAKVRAFIEAAKAASMASRGKKERK